ncbi:MAG: ribosome-binding factor A [Chloroflexi bacterium RBG_16_58_8]|nr:MAG: ribosome-binding factor A [Chloroflexi bacterium RBG_16_58_8]
MSHRIERVNTLIRREISELIQHQLRDPRLDAFVAVTEVVTSPDLKFARIYISSIGGQQEKDKVLGVLNAAAGYLRTELARNVQLRHTPELSFHWDNSIEHGDRILRLLDQVNAENQD